MRKWKSLVFLTPQLRSEDFCYLSLGGFGSVTPTSAPLCRDSLHSWEHRAWLCSCLFGDWSAFVPAFCKGDVFLQTLLRNELWVEASKHTELIHSKKPALQGGKINLSIAFSKHFKQLAEFNLCICFPIQILLSLLLAFCTSLLQLPTSPWLCTWYISKWVCNSPTDVNLMERRAPRAKSHAWHLWVALLHVAAIALLYGHLRELLGNVWRSWVGVGTAETWGMRRHFL